MMQDCEMKKLEIARNCLKLAGMTVLELIAEQKLGPRVLNSNPALRAALNKIDGSIRGAKPGEDERARVASLVELFAAYQAETDSDEKANILRTLQEIAENQDLELPTSTIDEWEKQLVAKDRVFAEAKKTLDQRRREFQKKYFSFRAKAGLQTQEAVAKRSGLRRSYVAVIEAGVHLPQQKTLQKLAKAFEVDVAELLA
jgi:DNA-binding XRE family transcriptional regulator